ncbi:AP-5 complex subunit sigma-1-like [Sinocyclocheilus rhinocerous]|uniref:AP-5 complex subunit sigma-1-like n=1 Tax=Sinocyclocheilus rhinocerous TaxID=307959 RepID=A0A673M9N8_9TELE|nr:PREDICTED: AP-5 complex subunit sigma-1-like [Sinocyclocheilus rhinocerous]XP_016381001.1 PREDICTED: AP-5 complex subunit sigma-1-like [Sinocyclocheilus rhinocerous]
MVVCFLIHTVCPVSALSAGETRILYARVFGPETGDGCDFTPEQRRLMQKEKLHVVARQVRSAVALSREASGGLCVEAVLGEEAAALGEADSGVFSLGNAELFPDRSVVLWLGVQSLAFSLVCRPHENLLLAEGTLRNIARHCLEELRLLGPGAEVLLKSDRVDALLHRLLPHGQLLFFNHRFVLALDKDIANYVSK